MTGLWRHHELWDGTYSFADLVDAHELLDEKNRVERQMHKAMMERKAEA
jgi:hypothetical protein